MLELATRVALLFPLATLPSQDGVSQAGAAQARLFAARDVIPPPATFVVADIVNERRHDLSLPRHGEDLALDLRWSRASHPADSARATLQVGIATGAVPDRQALRPVNLALSIDCSGSMAEDRKLERVREALLAFVDQLRPSDRVAVIAWSDRATVLRASQPVADGHDLRRTIHELRPGGNTNLHGGLMCALTEVGRTRVPGGTNRVILLTDGIANAGVTDARTIATDATLLRAAGIDVTTIGFGQNAQVELLREIAATGRGAFHFVADHEDISKLFVREVQSLLSPVARRLRLVLETDPPLKVVRLLGHPSCIGLGLGLGERLEIPLEDMNHHASQVVLAEVTLGERAAERGRPSVRARMCYVDARTGEERTLARAAALDDGEGPGASSDVDLRRNLAIANLGIAMREMATSWHAGRSGDARAILSDALGAASIDPQISNHPDVARVMATAARYRDVLDRHREIVDRRDCGSAER